jgi:hypothetical protein
MHTIEKSFENLSLSNNAVKSIDRNNIFSSAPQRNIVLKLMRLFVKVMCEYTPLIKNATKHKHGGTLLDQVISYITVL